MAATERVEMEFAKDDFNAEFTERFMEKVRKRIEKRKEPELTSGQFNSVFEEVYGLCKRIMSDD